MFDQIFFWPQVKRGTIFRNKHGIYEYPRELNEVQFFVINMVYMSNLTS